MAPAGKNNAALQDRVAAAAAVGLGPNANWAQINAARERQAAAATARSAPVSPAAAVSTAKAATPATPIKDYSKIYGSSNDDREAAAIAVGLPKDSNWEEINAANDKRLKDAEYAKLMKTATPEQNALLAETPEQAADRIRGERAKLQDDRAKALMNQSFAQARQELDRQNQAQVIEDELAAQENAAATASAGAAATGAAAGKGLPEEKKGAKGLAQEGAANMPTNIPPAGMKAANAGIGNSPGPANQFTLPNIEGLVFGGG